MRQGVRVLIIVGALFALAGCGKTTSLISNPLERFHNTLKMRTGQEQKDYDAFLNAPAECIKKCVTMPAHRVRKIIRRVLHPAKPQKAGS